MVVEKQMSMKDRTLKKKYMGVCSWGSERMARMMSRFPVMVTRYMMRKRMKSGFWSSGREERPRSINSETLLVWLSLSIALCLVMYKKVCYLSCSIPQPKLQECSKSLLSSIWALFAAVLGNLVTLMVPWCGPPFPNPCHHKALMLKPEGTKEVFSFRNHHSWTPWFNFLSS